MPIDYSKYPANWHEFSRFIRHERAGNKCEWCGAENHKPRPRTGSTVVLTVAHLDGKDGVCKCEAETGNKCAIPEHVVALCQSEHLKYDGPRHAFNARRTRAAQVGQLWLGDIEHRHAPRGEDADV